MNSKKSYFFISISLIFVFVLALCLFLSFLFFESFKEYKVFFFVFLFFLALALFLFLSLKILNPLFKSEENIKDSIKTTIHELNIPVSTIKMNIAMLKKSIKNEKDLQRLDRIALANDNLYKLYTNMEYKLKKELNKIDLEEFLLDEIIKTSLLKFEDIKKNTKIVLDIKKGVFLYTDYNGFLILLDNLISNAIKYNDKEEAYIKIEFKKDILSIFNKGEKLDAKNIIMVFDKYFQSSSSNEGFGLGLAIVKEFCDTNGILINIETSEEGNKFNLNLKKVLLKNIST